MKQTILSPLIASLLIAILGQSSTAQSPKSHNEAIVRESELLAELFNSSAVNILKATSLVDEKTAFNLVWKLPIVQRKAREIEQLSKGTIKVAAVLDGSPDPDESYYTIRVIENHVKYVETIYWFRVLTTSGKIEVLDLVENKYIALEEWKPN